MYIDGIKVEGKIKRSLRKWKEKALSVKILLSVCFVFFVLEAVVQLVPFICLINDSLKTFPEYAQNGSLAITQSWNFDNYRRVFSEFVVNGDVFFLEMLFNTMWQSCLYVVVNLMSSLCIAYIIAKFNFPGRNLLFGIMIFTQTIPIVGVGAAAFKFRYALGMYDNPFTLWFAWAVGFDYSAFVMYGTFQGVSNSYAESAEIDGANEMQIFMKIIIPQVFPLILALSVENFIARWNDYTTAQIDLPSYPTLSYGIYLFQLTLTAERTIYFAALVVTAIPGVLLYVFFQNFIIKNVSVGGIKG